MSVYKLPWALFIERNLEMSIQGSRILTRVKLGARQVNLTSDITIRDKPFIWSLIICGIQPVSGWSDILPITVLYLPDINFNIRSFGYFPSTAGYPTGYKLQSPACRISCLLLAVYSTGYQLQYPAWPDILRSTSRIFGIRPNMRNPIVLGVR